MATNASWGDVKAVARALTNREPDRLRGVLEVSSAELLQSLVRCATSQPDVIVSFVNPTDIDQVQVGQRHALELHIRPGFGVVARNLEHFLQVARAKIREPKNFILLSENAASDEPGQPDSVISRYRQVLALIQTIKSAGAYLDQDDEKLILFGDGRFDLPVLYAASDVASFSLEAVNDLTTMLPAGVHLKQCQAIFSESVIAMCTTVLAPRRFATLLAGAKELRDRFEKSYDLFASGFSYEKVRDEIEAARVEYTGKIHKVFSDIQNQLLGVPVATIVVATQMKPHDKIAGDFWSSVAVLLGSLVFGLLMILLLRNQRYTLEVIGAEITRQKKKLEGEHSAIAPNFSPVFQHLETRARAQGRNLVTVDCIVVLGMLLSMGFFYNVSGPTQTFVHALRDALVRALQ
jgi:hypothetical protein